MFSVVNVSCSVYNFFCIKFFCRKSPNGRLVNIKNPGTFAHFRPFEETVFIIHGFNGTANDKHLLYLKDGKHLHYFAQSPDRRWLYVIWILYDFIEFCMLFNWITAYLSRRFNVVLVDWRKLAYYPCYFSALRNIKLVAQCTAQVILAGELTLSSQKPSLTKIVGETFIWFSGLCTFDAQRIQQQANYLCRSFAWCSYVWHDLKSSDDKAASNYWYEIIVTFCKAGLDLRC